MIGNKLTKIMEQLLLMFCMLKKKKYILLMFQSNNSNCEDYFNDSKSKPIALSCSKKLSALLRGINSKHCSNFYCLNCLHSFRTKKQKILNQIKEYVKIKIFVK